MKTVKKLARAIGVLGGIAAIVWAMRDRLISIATPREPEPPRFKVVPPSNHYGEDLLEGDDLTSINGVGPVFASRLRQAGISTFADLAQADPDQIADVAQVPESRAADWIRQAGSLTG